MNHTPTWLTLSGHTGFMFFFFGQEHANTGGQVKSLPLEVEDDMCGWQTRMPPDNLCCVQPALEAI